MQYFGLFFLTAKKGQEKKAAAREDLSDMDYLKSKVVKDSSSSSTEEETDSEETEEDSESEEDSDTVETVSTHTEKKGKAKAQKPQQESPAEKKKKGSTLQVLLNYILSVLKQELHGMICFHWLLQGWDWKLEICKTPRYQLCWATWCETLKKFVRYLFSAD